MCLPWHISADFIVCVINELINGASRNGSCPLPARAFYSLQQGFQNLLSYEAMSNLEWYGALPHDQSKTVQLHITEKTVATTLQDYIEMLKTDHEIKVSAHPQKRYRGVVRKFTPGTSTPYRYGRGIVTFGQLDLPFWSGCNNFKAGMDVQYNIEDDKKAEGRHIAVHVAIYSPCL